MATKTPVEKYTDACAIIGQVPKHYIVQLLSKSILHVKLDRILFEEWKPIFQCIENDSMLKEIKIELVPTLWGVNAQNRFKSNFTTSIRNQIIKSVVSCLTCSPTLEKLSFINFPFKKPILELLCKGLARNQSLKELCLKGSLTGHKSFTMILPFLKRCVNIRSLDLTSCKLNSHSCELIASLLRSQVLKRHTETWKQSLRYNDPDVNAAPGLRRITLNGNNIGDEGAEAIATALQDDFWLKALDLQQCGLSDEGAKSLLVMLEESPSISVLDVRLNTAIDSRISSKIDLVAKSNSSTDCLTYNYGELFNKTSNPRSKKGVRKSISNLNMRNSLNESKSSAAAASKKSTQYESYYNQILRSSIVKQTESLNDIDLHDTKAKFSPILIHKRKMPYRSSGKEPTVTEDGAAAATTTSLPPSHDNQIYKLLDELQSDVKIYKEELQQEKERTRRLEVRIRELEREKEHLELQGGGKSGSELDPELLDTIESSFAQFHNFLDLLKQAGYSELCQLVTKTEDS